MTWLGAEHSFENSARGLKELFGLEFPTSTLRHVTLAHAGRLEAIQREEESKPYRSIPAGGASQLIAQADGSMVATIESGLNRKSKRPRDWKEVRLVSVQAVGAEKPIFAATFDSVAQTANQWGHAALKAGRGLQSQVHIVGNVASWVSQQSKEVFGNQGRFLVDFYHVSEYLGEASKTCRPSNPKQWLKTQQNRLKKGNYKKVLDTLTENIEPENWEEEDSPVRKAHRYIANRADHLHYDEVISKSLPIGSGTIESGHKHVLQCRLKKAGAAWLLNNAESMARMRSIITNGNWDAYWSKQFVDAA